MMREFLIGKDKTKMNIHERVAYNYLLGLGYKEEAILYFNEKSPDFIASKRVRGKTRYSGWEVKTEHPVFTKTQLSSMDYDTNILVVDETRVLYHKRLYEIVIPNYIKYNSGAGKTELQINGRTESGFFHPVMIEEWSKDDNHWSWQEMFRREGIPPLLLFGLCPLSKLLNRDGSINVGINELEKIKNNISNYFMGMEEREEQYKRIKELVWWV